MKKLTVYVGPVHSEKTSRAMQTAKRYRRLKHKVVLVRPKNSRRAHERPGVLVAKSGSEFPSNDLDDTTDIERLAADAEVLWIDEPMLFVDEAKVFDVIQRVRSRAIVIISGLSATSEMEVFGSSMAKLMAVADEIFVCKADCDLCGDVYVATRSICLKPKQGQVLVGGEETYQAACPECWTKYVREGMSIQPC